MISQEAIALNKLDGKIVCCSKFGQFHQKNRKFPDIKLLLLYASSLSIIFVISGSCYPFEFNSVRAETGSGTDIFRVIVTILGADKDKYRRCSRASYRKRPFPRKIILTLVTFPRQTIYFLSGILVIVLLAQIIKI